MCSHMVIYQVIAIKRHFLVKDATADAPDDCTCCTGFKKKDEKEPNVILLCVIWEDYTIAF